jgi:hypothetical protein
MMRFFKKANRPGTQQEKEISSSSDTPFNGSRNSSVATPTAAPVVVADPSLVDPVEPVHLDEPKATWKAIILGVIASIGGFLFGYESGQISGKFPTLWYKNFSDNLPRFSPDD